MDVALLQIMEKGSPNTTHASEGQVFATVDLEKQKEEAAAQLRQLRASREQDIERVNNEFDRKREQAQAVIQDANARAQECKLVFDERKQSVVEAMGPEKAASTAAELGAGDSNDDEEDGSCESKASFEYPVLQKMADAHASWRSAARAATLEEESLPDRLHQLEEARETALQKVEQRIEDARQYLNDMDTSPADLKQMIQAMVAKMDAFDRRLVGLVCGLGGRVDAIDRNVRLLTMFTDTSKSLRTLTGHGNHVYSVAISPDGQTIASGSIDNTVRVWNLGTGECVRALTGHSSNVWAVAISPDGQTIVSGACDSTVRVWKLETGELLRTLPDGNHVYSVAISPDGKTIVSGSRDNTLRMWNLETGEHMLTLSGHTSHVWSVAVSPDGQTIVSGGCDSTVRVWKLETGGLLRTLSGHGSHVYSVAISPDGQTIVSGSQDNTLRVWNLETGEHMRTLSGHTSYVWSVAISPDGQAIASGSQDGTVRVWKLETGEQARSFSEHGAVVRSVAISPNGQIIVSGAQNNTVREFVLCV